MQDGVAQGDYDTFARCAPKVGVFTAYIVGSLLFFTMVVLVATFFAKCLCFNGRRRRHGALDTEMLYDKHPHACFRQCNACRYRASEAGSKPLRCTSPSA